MLVASLEAEGFRNLVPGLGLEFDPALNVLTGPNGAGKSNLLDALHYGLTGASLRAGSLRNAIAFESPLARVELVCIGDDGVEHKTLSSIDRSGDRRSLVDGAPPSPQPPIPRISVFHPDRLQLVKGAPAFRRSHLDQLAGSIQPSLGDLRSRYGRTLAQRNAQVRRVKAGEVPIASLEVWDSRLAGDAEPLIASRRQVSETIEGPFGRFASSLGLDRPGIDYRPRADLDRAGMEQRLAELRADGELGRGYVMFGPHLDELKISAAGKSLKQFGSQGQQRIAVLALLLAEREVIGLAGQAPPILALDDVMSELDPTRRQLLVDAAAEGGQTIITATEPEQVPAPTNVGKFPVREYQVEDGRVVGIDGGSGSLSEAA